MNQRPQAVPKRRLLGLSLAALLALAALTMLALPALPKADSGTPTVAKKKKQKKITGTLTQGGYTVIALTKDGEAKTDRAPKGAFKLRPPAKKVTLHLRASDGTYAGPIVVGTRKQGKRAIEGVYAGAKLGKVKVKAGYAKLKLRKKWVDKKREARAKKGVPIGAGNFGRVKSKKTKGGAPGDLDLDGIADPLDIDDDGDKVLDNLDRKPRKGSKARVSADAPQTFTIRDVFGGGLTRTSNANVPGTTTDDINEFMRTNNEFTLEMDILPGDFSELDCAQPQSRTDPTLGGLVYCTEGGTGELSGDEVIPAGLEFPECCDKDHDDFGEMVLGSPGTPFGLVPFATSDQIGPGDLFFQHVTTDGTTKTYTGTLQYVFVTTPALISYDDGQGNSGSIGSGIDYPVDDGEPGTRANPFPVKANANGNVKIEFELWRPQRRPIPPEDAGTPEDPNWIDIGGLDYGAVAPEASWKFCGGGSLSSDDPNLRLTEGGFREESDQDGFRDLRGDEPADPSEKITFTVNVTKCLAERGESFNVGEVRDLAGSALTPAFLINDNTTWGASFIRE